MSFEYYERENKWKEEIFSILGIKTIKNILHGNRETFIHVHVQVEIYIRFMIINYSRIIYRWLEVIAHCNIMYEIYLD